MKIPGTKIELHDHSMTCPNCGTAVIVSSPVEEIMFARRTCPACQREFLIEDGKPRKSE